MTRLTAITSAMVGVGFVASSAMAQFTVPTTVTFGSNNDGLGGFTQSTTDFFQESWSTEGDSVRYINDDPSGVPDDGTNGGTRNGSLLAPFTLDRSAGKAYTVTGVVNLTDGYAGDNNRVGIYFFGDVDDLGVNGALGGNGQDEDGAFSLLFNTDDRNFFRDPPIQNPPAPDTGPDDDIFITEGIDNGGLSADVARNEEFTIYAGDLFGTTITLAADIAFDNRLIDDDGDPATPEVLTDVIDVVGSMTDADGAVTVTETVTLQAADYTGDLFGFVTRARNRGTTNNTDRDAPWTMDYLSFSIAELINQLPGDANGDGQVTGADLSILDANFGMAGGFSEGDFNGDGMITGADLSILDANFGTGVGEAVSSSVSEVPEPASIALIGLGGLALLRRNK